jgi:hypothetical protein
MTIEPGSLKPLLNTLEGLGYAQFSAPGDRHGSWEWPFYKDAGGLTLFVIFAATPEDGSETFVVELWIGAQADRGFVRKLVHSQRTRGEDLAGFAGDLARHAERAARQAAALKLSDLTVSPLSPRDRASLGMGTPPRRLARG